MRFAGAPRVAHRVGRYVASADRRRGQLCTVMNPQCPTYRSGKVVQTNRATSAAITSFQSAKDHAENVLDCALADLDEAYENSTGFQGYVPSEDISVCGALEDMGASDLDRTFRRSLQEMYKFHALGRQVA